MDKLSQVIPQIANQAVFILVLLVGLLLLLFYFNRGRIYQAWHGIKTRYCLNHLGQDQLSNIQCPDGLDDYFNIDRLVLREEGISLLVYKQYPGKIFCADHIDEWTQMLGQKSYTFKNPLFELDYQVKAISSCVPGIDINGYLFFDHHAQFPKGHPERVIHPNQIPEALKRKKRAEVDNNVLAAWHRLKNFNAE